VWGAKMASFNLDTYGRSPNRDQYWTCAPPLPTRNHWNLQTFLACVVHAVVHPYPCSRDVVVSHLMED
jgi:hypothetical protein